MAHYRLCRILMAASILAVAACKKESVSEVKTLENFATTGISVQNSCVGTYPLTGKLRLTVEKGDTASMKAIVAAVRAIPPNLQKLYFESDGGHIFATKDFNRACKMELSSLGSVERGFFAGGLPQSSACTRISTEQKAIVLQFKPNAKLISHQLVRIFGLNYGRMYGPRRFKDWNDVMGRLAVTFTREVATSNGKYSLAPYADLFATRAGQQMYDQFVFGEAFDSYYCADSTRKSFAKNFPETFLTFNSIAKLIEK